MWGPDVLRKAYRVTAYKGMLALRLEAQRDRAQPAPASPPPAGASTRRPAAASRPAVGRLPEGAKVVPVAAMGLAFPGLIDRRSVDTSAAAAASPSPPESTTTTPD